MAYRHVWLVFLLFVALVGGCGGGIEDKEGNRVKVGETYLMTKKGLEPLPKLRDKAGNPLEAGRQYVMTAGGLELVPHLKDKTGKKLELGNEYLMTEEGLRLVQTRAIKGVVQDRAGKALQGVTVHIEGSEHKASTGANGVFSLPYMEGYLTLALDVPNLPKWCKVEKIQSGVLSREAQPTGWDAGAIQLPCVLKEAKGDKAAWAGPDGRFIDNGDGTVTDTQHGLMWEAEVREHGVSWPRGVAYCQSLNLGGYGDWRLPTQAELATITQGGSACSWHGTPVITGALSVWASEQPDPATALSVNLCSGSARKAAVAEEGPGVGSSALAVRSLKP